MVSKSLPRNSVTCADTANGKFVCFRRQHNWYQRCTSVVNAAPTCPTSTGACSLSTASCTAVSTVRRNRDSTHRWWRRAKRKVQAIVTTIRLITRVALIKTMVYRGLIGHYLYAMATQPVLEGSCHTLPRVPHFHEQGCSDTRSVSGVWYGCFESEDSGRIRERQRDDRSLGRVSRL